MNCHKTKFEVQQSPNVLIIMCDQLTTKALSCYGGPVSTPNIDRLAAEGIIFDEAICPTPYCSPSRASFITGLYPHAHGINYNVNRRDYPAWPTPKTEEGIKTEDVTTEKLLHLSDYDTHHYGKWHLLDDDLPYYNDMYTEHDEHSLYMKDIFGQVRKLPNSDWMNWYGWCLPVEISEPLKTAVRKLDTKFYEEDVLLQHVTEFIFKMGRLKLPVEKTFDCQVMKRTTEALSRSTSTPFMLTCSLNYPHDPNVIPSPYYETVDPEQIILPSNFGTLERRFEKDLSRKLVVDLGEDVVREFLRVYYASVKMVDDMVGKILDALDNAGKTKETIIIFTADHGDMAGGHGMIWKSTESFYEEVVRVPLIIRYPGRLAPRRTSIAANLVDIPPTLLSLVGHEIPKHIQGHDLSPYLLDKSEETAAPQFSYCERIVCQPDHRRTTGLSDGHFMIRGQGWKYCRYHDGAESLCNLLNDPDEKRNIAQEQKYSEEKNYLKKKLEQWLCINYR